MEIHGLMIYIYLILPVLFGQNLKLVDRNHQLELVILCLVLDVNCICSEAMMEKSALMILIF